MKLLAIILLFTSTLGFSQNLYFKPTNDEFSKEFIRLVDSTRASIHGKRKVTYINPEWSSSKYRKSKGAIQWMTNEYEFNTAIDSNVSKACEHHNKYMYYLVIGEDLNPKVNCHSEDSIACGYKYKGKDTLIGSFVDRCNYYCGVGVFNAIGEAVWGSSTAVPSLKNMTSIELARAAYDRFMNSTKGHKDILINEAYTHCGINLYVDPEFKTFSITFVTGKIEKANI